MDASGDLNFTTARNVLNSEYLDVTTHGFGDFNITKTCDNKDSYMNAMMGYIEVYLLVISNLMLSVFAVCTNIVSMAILAKQGIHTCVSLCLLTLSATDLLCTLAGFCSQASKVLMFLNKRPGFDPFALYFFTVFLSATLYDVSNTLTAFLSLERCLCVCLPLKFKDMFTFRRVVTVIVCIYLLCFGLVMPHFLSSGFQVRSSGNSTYLALWLSADRAAVDVYIDAVHFCQTIVVTTVVFVCTLLMIVSLNRSSKFQGENTSTFKQHESPSRVSGGEKAKINRAAENQKLSTDTKASSMDWGSLTNACSTTVTADPNIRENSPVGMEENPKSNPKSGNSVSFFNSDQGIKNAAKDKKTHQSRNLNVIKTVIALCIICFTCNLSRVVVKMASSIEPRLRLGHEFSHWYQLALTICYTFQLLNCSLNIFVYYRFNQSFRATLQDVFSCRSKQ
ncbi:hypothetical protein EGW08_013330 [Elysia chlorotica]|uniref:G-protein coupled receptors family 1 profile domain-containing protein n=1 Tax=Elysia chlorotica TaxID=188477 RepID=A0A433TBE6_ELYCH|nr:hypothetical protein EGW08_013330 [Elysia chlorotica]